MLIPARRHIEQIEEGKHFCGFLEIGGVRLDYEFTFPRPISLIHEVEATDDVAVLRRMFQIVMKKEEAVLPLSDKEFMLFFGMLLSLAGDFYYDLQARNVSMTHPARLRVGRRMVPIELRVIHSSFSEGAYDFPEEVHRILLHRKFGFVSIA